jgi:hypothetical protein
MKKQIFHIFLLLIVSTGFTFAGKDPIKWGKILQADVNMKVYAADPDAPAVVLCDYGSVTVGHRRNTLQIL